MVQPGSEVDPVGENTAVPEPPSPEQLMAQMAALVEKMAALQPPIVHRTLMKKKFRLTQPVAEYINQQDGPEQKEDLSLAYHSVAR